MEIITRAQSFSTPISPACTRWEIMEKQGTVKAKQTTNPIKAGSAGRCL
jgi:hypothetical protein